MKTLYLKYDKKLILKLTNLVILDKKTKKKQKIDIDLTIKKIDKNYLCDIQKLNIKNNSIFVSTKLLLNKQKLEHLLFKNHKKLKLTNLVFRYDKHLPYIKAKVAYINYDGDDLKVTFDNPILKNIKLDGTKVIIENLEVNPLLKVDIHTANTIDTTILNLMKYYNLNLPLKQYNGTNNLNLQLSIPFDNQPLGIFFQGDIKNSKISYSNYNISSKHLNIVYKDNVLNIKGTKLHTVLAEQNISMDHLQMQLKNNIINLKSNLYDDKNNTIYISSSVDLNNKSSQGDIQILNFQEPAKQISINNQNISYKVEFGTKILADISSDMNIKFQNKNILFDKLQLHYDQQKGNFSSGIKLDNNSYKIKGLFDLQTKQSTGDVFIEKFDFNDTVSISNEQLHYKLDFNNSIDMHIASDMDIVAKKHNISLKNMKIRYMDNNVTFYTQLLENDIKLVVNSKLNIDKKQSNGKVDIINYNQNNIDIKNQTINYNLDYTDDIQLNIQTNMDLLVNKNFIKLKATNIKYQNKNINIYTHVLDTNKNDILIDNFIDLNHKTSQGDIWLKTVKYGEYIDIKNQVIPYNLNFSTGIKLDIEKFGLHYNQENKTASLRIENLNKLLENIKHIKVLDDDKKSQITLYSRDDFKNLKLIVNNLNLDINTTDIKDDNKTKQKIKLNLPYIDFKLFNSNINYNKIPINVEFVSLKGYKDHINMVAKPVDISSYILLDIKENNISLQAPKLDDKFINSIVHKKLFKDGYIDLFINGSLDKLKGKIKFHKTTLQDVRVINNLITFVNTTPALINPLLTLPTLFRLKETGFDMQGYYIKKGYVKFNFDTDKKFLDIYSLYTQGKMADFKGKATVDIVNEKIKAKVDVVFLKDYAKFLNNIPLVGYIITGKDGNFVTTVDIKGTFKKQDFETHTVKNASKGVVNVIKRTLSVPFLPFMDKEKKKKEEE